MSSFGLRRGAGACCALAIAGASMSAVSSGGVDHEGQFAACCFFKGIEDAGVDPGDFFVGVDLLVLLRSCDKAGGESLDSLRGNVAEGPNVPRLGPRGSGQR